MRGRRSVASRRSFADAQDDKGQTSLLVVILNEGCRSEGSTRSDFSVYRHRRSTRRGTRRKPANFAKLPWTRRGHWTAGDKAARQKKARRLKPPGLCYR